MPAIIELQNIVESKSIPSLTNFQKWVDLTLEVSKAKFTQPEVTIRVVSKEESQQLNSDYRQKDKPTNVLSFPFEVPDMIPVDEIDEYLGDLVICESVLLREAAEQHKPVENHWAHLTIHGLLHLLGYDHVIDIEAEEMESIEVKILAKLGITNPYTI